MVGMVRTRNAHRRHSSPVKWIESIKMGRRVCWLTHIAASTALARRTRRLIGRPIRLGFSGLRRCRNGYGFYDSAVADALTGIRHDRLVRRQTGEHLDLGSQIAPDGYLAELDTIPLQHCDVQALHAVDDRTAGDGEHRPVVTDRKPHRAVHPGKQFTTLVWEVDLHRHRARVLIERPGSPCDHSVKLAAGIVAHDQVHWV